MDLRLDSIIEAFSENCDPLEIARKEDFKDQKELGRFMLEKGYIWDSKNKNYFQKVDSKDIIARFYFQDNTCELDGSRIILSDQILKIEVDDYHSIPLFLNHEIYKKLISYVRRENIDYNRLIEEALDLYLESLL